MMTTGSLLVVGHDRNRNNKRNWLISAMTLLQLLLVALLISTLPSSSFAHDSGHGSGSSSPLLLGSPPVCFLKEIPPAADKYSSDDDQESQNASNIGEVVNILQLMNSFNDDGAEALDNGYDSNNSSTARSTFPELISGCYDHSATLKAVMYDSTSLFHVGEEQIENDGDSRSSNSSDDNNSDNKNNIPHTVYTGSTLRFGIQLKVSVADVVNSIEEPIDASSFQFHSRFYLCDAFQVGSNSCKQILKTDLEKEIVPAYSNRLPAVLSAGIGVLVTSNCDGGSNAVLLPSPYQEPAPPNDATSPPPSTASNGDGSNAAKSNPPSISTPEPTGINSISTVNGLPQSGDVGAVDATTETNLTTHIEWTTEAPGEDTQEEDGNGVSASEHRTYFRAAINVSLKVPDDAKVGAFYVVGEALIDFTEDDGTVQRVVVASSVPELALYVSQAPTIVTCTKYVKMYLGLLIGLAGTFALACLVFVVAHRKHPVMQLAQSPFLAALAAMCLVQTVFSFTYMPMSNLFCNLTGVFVLVPVHAVAAILIARMWRVHTTLASANVLGRRSDTKVQDGAAEDNKTSGKSKIAQRCSLVGCFQEDGVMQFLTWLARLPFKVASRVPKCGGKYPSQKNVRITASRSSIRQSATTGETAILIVLLTLPQLALQLFGVAFYRKQVEIVYNSDRDFGREMCSSQGEWVSWTGIALFSVAYFLAVLVAWTSRRLPSAFNETTKVFQAAAFASLLALVSFPLIAITSATPTYSPDITVRSQQISERRIGKNCFSRSLISHQA